MSLLEGFVMPISVDEIPQSSPWAKAFLSTWQVSYDGFESKLRVTTVI